VQQSCNNKQAEKPVATGHFIKHGARKCRVCSHRRQTCDDNAKQVSWIPAGQLVNQWDGPREADIEEHCQQDGCLDDDAHHTDNDPRRVYLEADEAAQHYQKEEET